MFKGIEAARGWLAWIVVISHIVYLNNVEHYFPKLKFVVDLGQAMVGALLSLAASSSRILLLRSKKITALISLGAHSAFFPSIYFA